MRPLEIVAVSGQGLTLRLYDQQPDGDDVVLLFTDFPWFAGQPMVLLQQYDDMGGQVCWPALDVDLDYATMRHPERYPLVHC